MSTTVSEKQNNLVAITILTLILMGGLVVYTFKGIFAALAQSYEVDTVVQDTELKIDQTSLENAYTLFYDRKIVSLEKGTEAPIIPTPNEENTGQ